MYKDDLWLFIDKLASFGYSINKEDQKSKVTVLAFDVVQKKKKVNYIFLLCLFFTNMDKGLGWMRTELSRRILLMRLFTIETSSRIQFRMNQSSKRHLNPTSDERKKGWFVQSILLCDERKLDFVFITVTSKRRGPYCEDDTNRSFTRRVWLNVPPTFAWSTTSFMAIAKMRCAM